MRPAVQKKEVRKERNKVSRRQTMSNKINGNLFGCFQWKKNPETQTLVILPSVNVEKTRRDSHLRDGRLLAHVSSHVTNFLSFKKGISK